MAVVGQGSNIWHLHRRAGYRCIFLLVVFETQLQVISGAELEDLETAVSKTDHDFHICDSPIGHQGGRASILAQINLASDISSFGGT
jgi:hypothetical protein